MGCRPGVRPVHDIIFEVARTTLADDATTRGGARYVHALRGPRNQRVPFWQIVPVAQKNVSAAHGQPVYLCKQFRRERYAVRYLAKAPRIICALTCLCVEQPTRDIRVMERFTVFVAELVKTASSAAITQGFPFRPCHVAERFCFPEGRFSHRV